MNETLQRSPDKNQIFAAIYARTSSPNQKSNYSIKEQVDRCWKYCKERSWIVRYVFVDEGESGKTVERPKFQLMLEKAKARKFDVIVFWKLDRLCRSLVDLVNVERMLREWEVGLCSVTEYIDTTTSIGRFNFRSIASVAELERELIGERARLGLYALAKEHKWPNPHPPLGYDKDNNGKLVINEDEAELVRKIFKMYIQEKSMPQVAFVLNNKGVLTKRGRKWNARAVRDVLTNEIYIGNYNVASVNHYVEEYRIIDENLFRKSNRLRLRYKAGGAKRPPMPDSRKITKIDKVFNEYLALLNSPEECKEKNFRCKVIKSESELFKLLMEGWSLIKVIEDKYIVRK
jgi:site-specific DNA recombinase